MFSRMIKLKDLKNKKLSIRKLCLKKVLTRFGVFKLTTIEPSYYLQFNLGFGLVKLL